MRPVRVFANGPGSEIEQLRAELHGRWRQATRAVMVLLSLPGSPPSQIAALLDRSVAGLPPGHGAPLDQPVQRRRNLGAGRSAAVWTAPAGRTPAGRPDRSAAQAPGPVDAAADPAVLRLAAGQHADAVPAGPPGRDLAAAKADCHPVTNRTFGMPFSMGRCCLGGIFVEVNAVPRIAGALTFRPTPHVDERGFFCRTFDADVMRAAGIDFAAFIQHSLSRSVRGVVRGLHVRRGDGEAKLVRCSFGAIFDVIVDLRPTSPTYQNWESFELRDDEQMTLYVPAGCAHGFQALSDTADVSYMIDRAHDPSEDVSIAFDDPGLAISWPLPVTIMSSRDRLAPLLADVTGLLAQNKPAAEPS